MIIDHNMKSFGGRDYDEPEPPQQFQPQHTELKLNVMGVECSHIWSLR